MTAQTMTSVDHHVDRQVVVGIDTHKHVHVAAAISSTGQHLDTIEISTDQQGFELLHQWATGLGEILVFGVEGTGSWGSRLTGFLTGHGYQVLEIDRPNRQTRRRYGKSDTADAYAAAHAALTPRRIVIPKDRTGNIEDLRYLQIARRSAVKDRTAAINQFQSLLVTAAQHITDQLEGTTNQKITIAATWAGTHDHRCHTLGVLAQRIQHLNNEITDLSRRRDTLVTQIAPALCAEYGVGPDSATELLITAGANPHRIHSEAAFAALCGTSCVDRSSGQNTHHSLNRGGNRQANRALYTIAITRMRAHPETITYTAKKTAEGKTKRDTRRRIQRALTRRLYPHILNALT